MTEQAPSLSACKLCRHSAAEHKLRSGKKGMSPCGFPGCTCQKFVYDKPQK